MTPGYYKRPEVTAERFHDGWLRTGDLAYLLDGELVVCGRMKDMIIVGGRNVFPEDIERALAEVDGVRAGNVIAFGVDRRWARRASSWWPSQVRATSTSARAVAARVRDAVGLPPRTSSSLPPGSLPKTVSGKLQRSLCRSATSAPSSPLPPCR